MLEPVGVATDFLYQLLGQRSFLTTMIGKAKGGAQGNLSKGDIIEYKSNLPTDLDEQVAIATVLSDMDAEITTLEQRQYKTKQIKQGMMQQLLTGQIRLVTPPEAEVKA